MSDIPIRSFLLKQNLQTASVLKAQFVQSETKSGLWQICVQSISIIFKEDINFIATLQCNLIKDLKYHNESGAIQSFNPYICCFPLKGKINEKKLIPFEKCWFQINAPSSDLKIYVRDIETETLLTQKCELFVNVFLQRIK